MDDGPLFRAQRGPQRSDQQRQPKEQANQEGYLPQPSEVDVFVAAVRIRGEGLDRLDLCAMLRGERSLEIAHLCLSRIGDPDQNFSVRDCGIVEG